MEYLWELLTRSVLLVIATSALFGGLTGYAIAAWGRINRVLGTAAGAVFGALALLVLFIVAAVRRSAERQRELAVVVAVDRAPQMEMGSTYSGFDSFETAPMDTGGMGFDVPASSGSLGFESFEPTVATPAATTAVPEAPPARRLRRFDASWVTSRWGIASIGLLLVALIATAVTLTTPWFVFNSGLSPKVRVFAIGTGIDVVLISTIVVLLVAMLAIVIRPWRIAAVAIAWVGGTWLVATLLTLSARESVTAFLEEIGAFEFTVGDMLGLESSDLGAVGLDPTAVDLTGAVSNIEVELGVSWWIMLGVVVVIHVAVVILLRGADARSRASVGTVE